jgi:hypothetical protein
MRTILKYDRRGARRKRSLLLCAEPFLHFAHVLAHIDRAANVAKMFKHEIFSFNHAASLLQFRCLSLAHIRTDYKRSRRP